MKNIKINGSTIEGARRVVIEDGKVVIDGKDHKLKDQEPTNIQLADETPELLIKQCGEIHLTGNVEFVSICQGDLTIEGDVNGNVTISQGMIEVSGWVQGNIDIGLGHVVVSDDVVGNINTNLGPVSVYGMVEGSIMSRMGDVSATCVFTRAD